MRCKFKVLMALRLSAAVAIAIGSSACGKKSQGDVIADAQTCLNTATSSTAGQCQQMVAGINSQQAFLIQCSALYIQQGFADPARLSNAFNQLTTSNGSASSGVNASLAALGILAFNSSAYTGAQNASLANQAQLFCQQSGSPGLILLAGMTAIATNIIQAANNISSLIPADSVPTPDQIAAAINSAKTDPNLQAAIGAVVSTTVAANCADPASANPQVCDQFSQAETACGGAATASNTCLGQQLLTQYSTSH